jgi:hypothetical protein
VTLRSYLASWRRSLASPYFWIGARLGSLQATVLFFCVLGVWKSLELLTR